MFNSVAQKGYTAAKWIGIAALLLLASNLLSRQITRTAERRSPPAGRFIEVDGVWLHYVEKGSGQPVVLLHGQGALLQDFTQTLFEPLAKQYRVIAFDRPGSGYSSRPSGVVWTPQRQAQLFRAALDKLKVRKPIVLGHSWGALAAIAYGVQFPRHSAGLVLLSGFYFPRGRALLHFANFAVQPVIRPLFCRTILPPLFELSEPLN